jgi:hypothetical protein
MTALAGRTAGHFAASQGSALTGRRSATAASFFYMSFFIQHSPPVLGRGGGGEGTTGHRRLRQLIGILYILSLMT